MSPASHPLLRAALGVLSAWSIVVLGVVEGGLGGRYSLHPDAAPDTGRIPEVRLLSGVGGVAGFDDYASIVQRPLFNEDRRPQAADSATDEAPAPSVTTLDLVLTSIVITGSKQIAILSDPGGKGSQSVAMGGALEGDYAGWRLKELQPRRAVFEGPGGVSELELRVFDGQGGEPPTPMAQPALQQGGGGQPGVLTGARQDGEEPKPEGAPAVEPDSPEARAEQIRRRIEERRRQMREEAERANAERGQ